MSVRVFVVDDHPVVVAGLSQALGSFPDIDVVGTAMSAGAALVWLAQPDSAVDVVIVDLGLPDRSGVDVVERLGRSRPDVRAIVLSAADAPDGANRALAAGAAGYLVKDTSVESLAAAVRSAAAGQLCVDPRVAKALVLPDPLARLCPLSQAEQEVLRLVANGLTNAQIGAVVSAAPSTVKTRISRLLTKLGARSRAEAVAIAVKGGLL
ncbi:MAG TPA: response regulator transcription factor [Mycobacteriales bacterium]|nr:response regulator transcription factor [Mycobacteriales bacterium]